MRRLLVAVALAVLASGCWEVYQSGSIPVADVDTPPVAHGAYVRTMQNGERRRYEVAELAARTGPFIFPDRGPGVRVREGESPDWGRVRFDNIGNDWWLGEWQSERWNRIGMFLLRVRGNEIHVYQPECGVDGAALDRTVAVAAGALYREATSEGTGAPAFCLFSDYRSLKTAAMELARRIDSGELRADRLRR